MRKLLVANIVLLAALNVVASETKGSRSLRGDVAKMINQKFTTKPKSKAELGPGVTEGIVLKPGKPSAYDNYFSDPQWDKQWYLHDYRTVEGPVMDHNVVPVYQMGYRGQGVRVGVVDDGVAEHYDLEQSYDWRNSWTCSTVGVYKKGVPDYVADFGWKRHGTNMAGLIGMDENVKCGVGVASRAKITSINVYHGWYTKDKYISQALNYDKSDIFCIGWGLPTSAFKNKQLRPDLHETISNVFRQGRSKKGSIFVITPGMSEKHETCWEDPLANHPDTFPIGVANNRGKVALGEGGHSPIRCAAVIATAYAGGDNDEDGGVVTTYPIDDHYYETGCTSSFRSASAGASIASGIIALVLNANGALTSRDVMHLIVAGAEVAPLAANKGTWSANKAGFWFSNDFGFGLLNAENMVDLALHWHTVPNRRVCTISGKFQQSIFKNYKELIKDREEAIQLLTDVCKGDNEIFYLEQIQLDAAVDYSHKGVLSIVVQSPQGTASKMLQHPFGKNKSVISNPSLKSYNHWGENPHGRWQIKFKLSGVKGKLRRMKLTLYGTLEKPAHYKPAPPYRSYSAFRLHGGIESV